MGLAGLIAAGAAAWADSRSKIAVLSARLAILEEEVSKIRPALHDTRSLVGEVLGRQKLRELEGKD